MVSCRYVVQFFLSPLLLADGFFPMLLSDLLYAAALSYYHYVNFLGYNFLPFLDRTELFLTPIWIIVLATPFLLLCKWKRGYFVLPSLTPRTEGHVVVCTCRWLKRESCGSWHLF